MAVNIVITNDNIDGLESIFNNFSKLPVNRITFQNLIFTEKEIKNKAHFLISEDAKLNKLIDFMKFIQHQKSKVKVAFFPNIPIKNIKNYYLGKEKPFKRTCILPWLTVRVYPNCDVKICDIYLGNIKKYTLKKVINSELAVGFRKKLKQKFWMKRCFRCCHRLYH